MLPPRDWVDYVCRQPRNRRYVRARRRGVPWQRTNTLDPAASSRLAPDFRGQLISPGDARLRRGPQGLQRHDRPPPRPDRALCGRQGRGQSGRLRAPGGRPGLDSRRRPQRRRARGVRRRARDRPLADARDRGRSGRRDRARAGRRDVGRGGSRHARARARGAVRDHLHDGRRRADAGRWDRPPVTQVRAWDRQPAGGRRGAGGRQHGHGQRGPEPGPVLGVARRRREFRRRDLVPVPRQSGRHGAGRARCSGRSSRQRRRCASTTSSSPTRPRT